MVCVAPSHYVHHMSNEQVWIGRRYSSKLVFLNHQADQKLLSLKAHPYEDRKPQKKKPAKKKR